MERGQVPVEPHRVSCAIPTPMPPLLGGTSPSTQPLPPRGCAKGEKTVGLAAGPRLPPPRGPGFCRGWAPAQLQGNFWQGRLILKLLLGKTTTKNAEPFSARAQQSCLCWAYGNAPLPLHLSFCFPLELTFFPFCFMRSGCSLTRALKSPLQYLMVFPEHLPYLLFCSSLCSSYPYFLLDYLSPIHYRSPFLPPPPPKLFIPSSSSWKPTVFQICF